MTILAAVASTHSRTAPMAEVEFSTVLRREGPEHLFISWQRRVGEGGAPGTCGPITGQGLRIKIEKIGVTGKLSRVRF